MACKYCGAAFSKRVQGRYKKETCGASQCQKLRRRDYARRVTARNWGNGLTAHGTPYKQKTPRPSARQLLIMTNRQLMREAMFARGKCAYHTTYFGCDMIVQHAYIEAFEWDHIDRSLKTTRNQNVARMVSRNNWADIERELLNCELVCSNCHQIKTRRNKDWQNVHIKTSNVPTTQLTLQLQ